MAQIGLLRTASLAVIAWTALSGVVLADDWMVDRLRGEVLVQVAGAWQALQRGDIVSDESRIRSLDGSRVVFTRGAEAIELSGATEIRIFDQAGQRMTTVMQAYGTVTVEAERLQVQHFSIQTPYLAAIVKGTRFTVHSSDGQSSVDVERGLVQVQDYVHGVATDITPGQSAVVSPAIMLDVSGIGAQAPLVTLSGQLVDQDNVVANEHSADGGNGPGSNNAGGNGHGNAFGLGNGNSGSGGGNAGGNDSGNAHGLDNGNPGNSGNNAGGNGNGNAHGGGNGNSGNGGSNAGGNGNGNAHGLDNGNPGNSGSNAGGNGNGNAQGGGNGNSGGGSNNAGGNGNGNAFGLENGNAGHGNNGNGNSGKGNGKAGEA